MVHTRAALTEDFTLEDLLQELLLLEPEDPDDQIRAIHRRLVPFQLPLDLRPVGIRRLGDQQVRLLKLTGHRHGVHERGAHGPLAAGEGGRKDDADFVGILTRNERQSVLQSLGGGVEEKLSNCLFRLKPPGFITPRQLLLRYLDSSPEKVQKFVLKPVLLVSTLVFHLQSMCPLQYCPATWFHPSRIVKLWSSTTMCNTICSLRKPCSFVRDVR